ncbi:MAG TPA: diphthamide synthesis protein [Acidobacteriota bacterium]|nr:diphthamide synthesis protein [Acidobacteriota bacterium]
MFRLELDKVVAEVKARNAKRVLIQLPDGLKTRAAEVVDAIQEQTGAQAFIWFSSCFGQCDYPLGLGPLGIDVMIQFGHNRYNKTIDEW